uniref:G-protein coupled receptors family 1 profile domain-containing protein n=1 Tax=Neolamprologus brichardi TaxID=32507 RepID=A0A3Q4MKB4_NEOBR
MELFNSALGKNITFVHPKFFIIGGLTGIPNITFYYVFLFFVYIVSVVGNTVVMAVIYLDHNLRTPKYIAVFNLAFVDLTALIPKLLDTFLFDRRYIVYEACLSYMFFVFFFGGVQSWTLVTMAYDRLIAICFPLRYHSIVTKTSITSMLLFIWLVTLSLTTLVVGLINRLSFCDSVVVKSFFCDHGPIYRLACNDPSLNIIMANVVVSIGVFIPLIFIACTYVCISIALSKIASGEERLKALKTCTSHLILVAILFLPFVVTNIAVWTSYIHPNARIINSTLTHTIPALINPIVYALKTEEVMNAVKKLWKINNISSPLCKRNNVSNTVTKW